MTLSDNAPKDTIITKIAVDSDITGLTNDCTTGEGAVCKTVTIPREVALTIEEPKTITITATLSTGATVVNTFSVKDEIQLVLTPPSKNLPLTDKVDIKY